MAAKNNFEVGFVFGAKKAATFDKAFGSVNKSISGIVKGIAGVVGAYAGLSAIKGAVDTYKDFEQSMANVAAVGGIAGEELKAMETAALEMGKKTSKTAKEAADALGYMALAGWDSTVSMQALEPVLRLSEAGNLDLARTSDLVTDSMSALGLKVEELPNFLDQVAQASRKSNADVGMMMEAFLGVGGSLSNLNVPLDEANTMLGVLANRGIKGSEAGTKLNALMTNLTTGAGQAGVAMKALGINAFDQTTGKFKGMSVVLKELNDKTKTLTEEQRTSYFAMIGGKTQIDTLNAMMSGLNATNADGVSEYDALRASIGDSNGALMDMAETMNNTMQGAFLRAQSAVDDFKIKAIKGIEPYMTPVINLFAEKLPIATEKFSHGMTAMIDKAIPIFTKLKEEADKAFTWVKDVATESFGKIQAVISENSGKFEAFGVAVKDVGGKVKDILEKGLEAVKPIIEWIATEGLPKAVDALGEVAEKATEIYNFITENWEAVKSIIIDIGLAFVAWNLPNVLAGAVQGIMNFSTLITGLPAKLGKATVAQWALVKSKIADKVETLQLVGLYVKDFAVALWGNIKAVASATGAWVANKLAMIGSKVATLALKGVQLASTAVTAGMTAAQWALNAAFIASPIGWIVLGIGALIAVGVLLWKNWDVIKAKGMELWVKMQVVFINIQNYFGAMVTGLANKFPLLATALSGPVETIKGIFNGLNDVFTGIIDFVTGVFTGDWQKAWEGVKGIFGGIFDTFASLAKAPINSVIGIINAAIEGINGINVEVPDWVPGMGGKTFGFAIPSIPMLAEGGIATAPTLAMVGEGKEKEAILPLSRLQGMLSDNNLSAVMSSFMTMVQQVLAVVSAGGGGGNITFAPQLVFNGPADRDMVNTAMGEAYQEFKQFMARYEQDKRRTAMRRG